MLQEHWDETLFYVSFCPLAVASEGPTMFGPVEEPEPVCLARGQWGLDQSRFDSQRRISAP